MRTDLPELPAESREVTEPCQECIGGVKHSPNPKWYRKKRLEARITLTEMARILSLHRKVSVQFLSNIELGKKAFPAWIAEMYQRLFIRYARSGQS